MWILICCGEKMINRVQAVNIKNSYKQNFSGFRLEVSDDGLEVLEEAMNLLRNPTRKDFDTSKYPCLARVPAILKQVKKALKKANDLVTDALVTVSEDLSWGGPYYKFNLELTNGGMPPKVIPLATMSKRDRPDVSAMKAKQFLDRLTANIEQAHAQEYPHLESASALKVEWKGSLTDVMHAKKTLRSIIGRLTKEEKQKVVGVMEQAKQLSQPIKISLHRAPYCTPSRSKIRIYTTNVGDAGEVVMGSSWWNLCSEQATRLIDFLQRVTDLPVLVVPNEKSSNSALRKTLLKQFGAEITPSAHPHQKQPLESLA